MNPPKMCVFTYNIKGTFSQSTRCANIFHSICKTQWVPIVYFVYCLIPTWLWFDDNVDADCNVFVVSDDGGGVVAVVNWGWLRFLEIFFLIAGAAVVWLWWWKSFLDLTLPIKRLQFYLLSYYFPRNKTLTKTRAHTQTPHSFFWLFVRYVLFFAFIIVLMISFFSLLHW